MASFPQSSANIMYGYFWKYIFEPEHKRLLDLVDDIALRNKARGGHPVMTVQGQVIVPKQWIKGIIAKPVNKDLENELIQIKNELNEFVKQRQYIKNCCSFLIPEVYNHQDCRDSLSDIISNYIPEYKELPRTRPEMFYILHSPVKIRQWEKANYWLEFYIGNLLVF